MSKNIMIPYSKIDTIIEVISHTCEGICYVGRIPGTRKYIVIGYNDTDGKYVDDFTGYVYDELTGNLSNLYEGEDI